MICTSLLAMLIEALTYSNVLATYEKAKDSENVEKIINQDEERMSEFSVTVTPFEREGMVFFIY